jgi:hypothetical protein
MPTPRSSPEVEKTRMRVMDQMMIVFLPIMICGIFTLLAIVWDIKQSVGELGVEVRYMGKDILRNATDITSLEDLKTKDKN